ncbi:MAG: T9SS type A sorting domain-containing protein [Candidatus Eisenbacteria bacterium]
MILQNRLSGPATLVAALLLVLSSSAAARDTTPPASFGLDLAALDDVREVILPPVDTEAYILEDEERMASEPGGPYRFAAPHYVDLAPDRTGTWEALEDGSRIWRLRVHSAGALSLNFGFTPFDVPKGAMLHVYGPDRRNVYGPYRTDDAAEGELWTPIVPGDRAVIELFVPAGAAFEPAVSVTQVNHDYRGFVSMAANKLMQGWCNNDVVCREGDPWRDDIRSEGVYTLQGYWTCSGQMVNSNTEEPPPYFLTAYHCGITTSNDHTVRVYWNFESPNCGQLAGGSLSDSQYGSVLRARYSTSDFCLIEFTQDPDTSFQVYYAGWDATGSGVPSCVAIHHPNCDEKAISFNTDPLTVTSYLGTAVPGNGTHWRVDDWEDGTTEPGSSGSGIWDPNHHLVGQLHGGYASCTSITSDWYGRLSVSWNGGGNSGSRLSDWLDPGHSGTLVLDGRDPGAIDTEVAGGLPVGGERSALFPISPNPTRGAAQVLFSLKKPGAVEIEVYSASGRLVSTMPARSFPAGAGAVTWDGSMDEGGLAAGVYFVRLRVDGEVVGTEKVVFLR